MIGFLLGLIFLSNYIGIAWTGTQIDIRMFAVLIVICVGVFLFPRTIGIAFTPMAMASPVLFVVSWVKYNFTYSLQVLLLGITAWLITFVISQIRRDAV
jgi:hypothetical protein